jgi:hypothetical protein
MPVFNMTVVAVEAKSAMSKANKPYKLVELAYKNNTYQGKLESVKINQYAPTFAAVSGMQQGQVYDVTKEKDASGFYQWLSVSQNAPGQQAATQPASPTQVTNISVAQAKGAYAEQDAKKQIYIVKQSAVKAAVDLLSIGAKTPPSTQSVLEQAQKFVDYVFEDKPLSIDDMAKLPNDLDLQVE